ncbi:MAG: hypothetical protein WC677_06875 [Clostridia bacterium]|jgi:tetratricopeptide (TPR) repeat protein
MAEKKHENEKKKIVPLKRDSEFYFKVGMKYANKKSTVNALKYFRKAVEIEPFNADYQFNLACILVELKQVEKANEILLGILMNIDPTLTECYFGIGCNYFDLSDLKKAKEYIEKYIYFAPEGQFIEEAYDILYYLQIYYDMEAGKNRGKSVSRIEDECKSLMDACDYKKGCKKLEKLVQIQPDSVWTRNNLSVAYFFTGETDKAISIAKSVLRLKPKDFTALCNLGLFYSLLKKDELYKKQIELISKLEIENRNDLIKVIETFMQLKEQKLIIKMLSNYLKKSKEPFLFHLLSLSLYNQKRFEEAQNSWEQLFKCYPQYKIFADFYIKLSSMANEAKIEYAELPLTFKLPPQTESKYKNKIANALKLSTVSLRRVWERHESIKEMLIYYLFEGEKDLKISIVNALLSIGKIETRAILKNLMSDKDTDDEIKRIISKGLGIKINDGSDSIEQGIIISTGCDSLKDKTKWKKEWESVIECALQNKELNYSDGYSNELKNIWISIVKRSYPTNEPKIKKREVWAAALEYIYCSLNLIGVSKTKIARKYNISATSLSTKLRDLNR